MQFSVNTFCLYGSMPLDEVFTHMKALGYTVFEQWMIGPAAVSSLRQSMDRQGMFLSAFCTGFFILNDESRHGEYEDALSQALQTTKKLSCPALITQVGQATGAPRSAQHDAIVKGLRRVAPLLESAGVTLLVEPLNDVKDHKGYYLTNSQEGFDIIREVGSPRVRLLFDVYHQLHMGEDVLSLVARNLSLIGHFHVAGYPNRDGYIFEAYDYRPLLSFLKRSQTAAPVGLELFPGSPEKADALLQALHEFC